MFLRSTITFFAAFLAGAGTAHWQVYAHGKKHNPVRYEYVMQNGIPNNYESLQNPLPVNAENLARGAKHYADNCASCHGVKGKGDGPDAKTLKPRPPELHSMMKMIAEMKHGSHNTHHSSHNKGAGREQSMMTEGYLYWTLSEGGEPVESPMPGFKDVLSDEERWQVILYMTNGFSSKPAH